jgi:hypothetical protein
MTKLTITLDIDAKELYKQRLLLAYLARFDIDEYPIDGLLNLTDAIADELSENGNDKALLTGSSQEDEMGTRMLDDLRQTLNFKPPSPSYTLKPYVVKLVEKGGCVIIDFPCDAEDADHAREQTENAYRGCTVKHIFEYVVSDKEDT